MSIEPSPFVSPFPAGEAPARAGAGRRRLRTWETASARTRRTKADLATFRMVMTPRCWGGDYRPRGQPRTTAVDATRELESRPGPLKGPSAMPVKVPA
jgi:hypothetical protein